MSVWQSILEQIKLNLTQFISESHAFIINNVLQSLFFTLAIIQIITWILNKLNLFFAKNFTKSNNILKGIIFVLFFYIKIWSTYSAYLQIIGYFCSVSVCIHLYEGCIRLGRYFCRQYSKNRFGNISSAISILLIFLSYKVFTLSQIEQKETKYSYVAVYFLVFSVILILSLLRRKQFIYVLILSTTMALIIMLRHWSIQFLKDTFLCKANIPFQCVFYLLFVLQQSYNSQVEQNNLKKIIGKVEEVKEKVQPSELLWAQVYYFLFFLINKRIYHIEIVFATICVLNYLGKNRVE